MRVSLPVIIMDMPATGFFKYLSEMDFSFVFKPGVDGWTASSNTVSGVVVVEVVVDGISQCRRKRRCWQGLFQEDGGRDRLDSAPSSAVTGPGAVVLVIAAGTLFPSPSFERRPLSEDDDEGLSLIPSTILSRLAVLR